MTSQMIDNHLAHIAGLEKKFGPNSEEVAVALGTLARLICQYEEPEDAVPYFERCIRIREALKGPKSVLPYLDEWINQSNQIGFKAREPFILKRLEIEANTLGEIDPSVADACASLASTYLHLNRTAEAQRFFERSLAIQERLGGTTSPDVATTLEALVDVCFRERKREQADHYLKRCNEVSESVFGANSKEMARTLVSLAVTLIASGRYARQHRKSDGVRKARPMFERALSIYEELFGPDSLEVQRTLETISRACLECGQFRAAEPLLKRLLAICEQIYGNNAAASLWVLSELAQGYADEGSTLAEPMLERSFDVLRSFLDARRPIVRDEIADLPGNKEVLHCGRGGLLEKLVRTSEKVRRNTRTRWGASG